MRRLLDTHIAIWWLTAPERISATVRHQVQSDIREAHPLKLAQLPLQENHKDPFDRLLIAQCLSESLFLLTADRALRAYGDMVISEA